MRASTVFLFVLAVELGCSGDDANNAGASASGGSAGAQNTGGSSGTGGAGGNTMAGTSGSGALGGTSIGGEAGSTGGTSGGTGGNGGNGGTGNNGGISGMGGMGGMGGTGTGAQGGASPGPCSFFPLTNHPDECQLTYISPLAGEETHWVAERLTPSTYPFTVTAIRYALGGQELMNYCDTSLAHQVELFVGPDDSPAMTPVTAEHFDIPTSMPEFGIKLIDLDLMNPLTLQSGEHLFVMIQNAGVSQEASTCFIGCTGPTFVPNRSYWSNSGTPPFPWATLESFGLLGNYSICADGS